MKRLPLILMPLLATSALADHGERPLNLASELRDWCKEQSETALTGRGASPSNWSARYWDQGNVLMVKGQWRVDGAAVIVECTVARGAAARTTSVSIRDAAPDAPPDPSG